MGKFKNKYVFSKDGKTAYGITSTGERFLFDAEDFNKIKNTTWYKCNRCNETQKYIGNSKGVCIHRIILQCPPGFEIDHINLNPLDNRKTNLRICSHQQNHCNQPLQKNNTSGVTGVGFYRQRKKYRARIKFYQRDLHLGYYKTFLEAVQARNEGMRILFGEFAIYTPAPETPNEIKKIVAEKCSCFLNKTGAFFEVKAYA